PAPRNARRVIGAMSRPSHRRGSAHHRADHTDVATTAAEVAGQRLLHLGLRGPAILLEKGLRRHDHAHGAVPALLRLLRDERRLDRVRALGRAEPFDRGDRAADGAAHWYRARADGLAVEMDGARAALAEPAPELRPGQSEVVAEDVEQRRRGIVDLDAPRRPVYLKRECRHGVSL